MLVAVFLGAGAYIGIRDGYKGLRQKKLRFTYPGGPKFLPSFLYGTPAIVCALFELALSLAALVGAIYFLAI